MIAYKHHIAKHFIERPDLIKNNGAGVGATIFLNFEDMLKCLSHDHRDWYYCTIEVDEADLNFNFGCDYMATLLVSKRAIDNYKPIEGR